jgi:hypothetical protein
MLFNGKDQKDKNGIDPKEWSMENKRTLLSYKIKMKLSLASRTSII